MISSGLFLNFTSANSDFEIIDIRIKSTTSMELDQDAQSQLARSRSLSSSNSFLSADRSYFRNSLITMSTSTPNGAFLATETGSSTSDIPFTYEENFTDTSTYTSMNNNDVFTVQTLEDNTISQVEANISTYLTPDNYFIETDKSNGFTDLGTDQVWAQGVKIPYFNKSTIITLYSFNITTLNVGADQNVTGEIWAAQYNTSSSRWEPSTMLASSEMTFLQATGFDVNQTFVFDSPVKISTSDTEVNATDGAGHLFFIMYTELSTSLLFYTDNADGIDEGETYLYQAASIPPINPGDWVLRPSDDITLNFNASFSLDPTLLDTKVYINDNYEVVIPSNRGFSNATTRFADTNFRVNFSSTVASNYGISPLINVTYTSFVDLQSIPNIMYTVTPNLQNITWSIQLNGTTFTNSSSVITKYFTIPSNFTVTEVYLNNTQLNEIPGEYTTGTDINGNQLIYFEVAHGNYSIFANSTNLLLTASLQSYIDNSGWVEQNNGIMGVLYPVGSEAAGDIVLANITNIASLTLTGGNFNGSLRTSAGEILARTNYGIYTDTSDFSSTSVFSTTMSFSTVLDPNIPTGYWSFQFRWFNGTAAGAIALEFMVFPVASLDLISPSVSHLDVLEEDIVNIEVETLDHSHNSNWTNPGVINWDFDTDLVLTGNGFNSPKYSFIGSLSTDFPSKAVLPNINYTVSISFSDGPFTITTTFVIHVFYRADTTHVDSGPIEVNDNLNIDFAPINLTEGGGTFKNSSITYILSTNGVIHSTSGGYDSITGYYNLTIPWSNEFTLGSSNEIKLNWTLAGFRNDANVAYVAYSFTFIVEDVSAPLLGPPPSDFFYNEGDTGNTIIWDPSDPHPDTYNLLLDSMPLFTNVPWTNVGVITIDADGLAAGVHLFAIEFFDVEGNSVSDTVSVTVFDVISPTFTSPPANFTIDEEAEDQFANWTVNDLHPDNYTIYEDGINVTFSNSWLNGGTISYRLDHLTLGEYNITILAFDESGNNGTHTVFVTVVDITAPTISTPTSYSYEEFSNGNTISWTGGDTNPNNYEIFKDTISNETGTWSDGVPIQIGVDGLALGDHNFTIVIYDTSGNPTIHEVTITVVDTAVPTISTPASYSYEEFSTGNTISWTGGDAHPNNYEIFKNTVSNETGTWSDGVPIQIGVDGLALGDHNFTIVIYDTSGNPTIHEVTITVVDTAVPTISTPASYSYEEFSTGNTISWTGGDAHPNNYEIFKNTVSNETGTWSDGVPIQIGVDGLALGDHNFTIVIYDTSGNPTIHEVTITVVDTAVPTISTPASYSYEEFLTGNTISWTGGDAHPNNYEIFKDTISNETGIWSDGVPIQIGVDGLALGDHNFTIVIYDTSGNPTIHEVIITVVDTVVPTISTPASYSYEEFSTGNTISWTGGDAHPNNYEIFKNTVSNETGTWSDGVPIQIGVDGLSLGDHNFTIVIYDTSGNPTIHEVIITVVDTAVPTISTPASYSYEEFSTGNTISWTGGDAHPNNYEIFKNTVSNETGTWSDGVPIQIGVDGLSLGDHNFTIVIYDTSGNPTIHEVIITVVDTAVPTISTPASYSYEEFSTGNTISWTGGDAHPNNYEIFKNTVSNETGTWSDGVPIQIGVDGLSLGDHNFTIVIYDTSGNPTIHEVIITVVDTAVPTISTPASYSYEEFSTGNTISWTGGDAHPNNYEIFKNTVSNETGTWSDGVPIQIGVDGLALGDHNFTIVIYDTSGNPTIHEVIITVVDTVVPTISTPASYSYEEFSTGNTISWTGGDAHPNNYEIFKDTISNETGIWSDGLPIQIGVDGLALGDHNFTIVIYDTSGNPTIHEVTITVVDTAVPTISTPASYSYEEFSTGNTISWTGGDAHPNNYEIFKNTVSNETGTWSDGVPIQIGVDGLSLGDHNFTIVIYDTSGNPTIHEVIITVVDTAVPTISTPASYSYEEFSTGNTISWTGGDAHPNNYEIFKNTVSNETGTWSDGVPIQIGVDGLSLGDHNFTIVIYDTSGNPTIHEVIITVVDTAVPTISTPASYSYEEFSTGNTISWTGGDAHPNNYEIFKNTVSNETGTWSDGVPIQIGVDGLSLGDHNFTIVIYDTSGNPTIHEVTITVVDTTAPTISTPSSYAYVEFSTGNTITWTGGDAHPNNYEIFKDTVSNDTGIWSTGVPIQIGIDGLSLGDHNFTIVIYDTSGNPTVHEVTITVDDIGAPTISTPPSYSYEEFSTGNTISWNGGDANPNNYTIFRDNVSIENGTWNNVDTIEISVDGLTLGDHNFTIVIYDTSRNPAFNEVIITVVDTNAPTISTPLSYSYEEFSTGKTISWTGGDAHPNNYEIFKDTVSNETGIWSDGVPIQIGIDGLSLGDHNFTIVIYDSSGNPTIHEVTITVVDTIASTITTPSSYSYEEFDTGKTISWTGGDAHPNNYEIFKDSVSNETGIWSDGVPIQIGVDGLVLGDHNFTIVIYDTSGNPTIHEVIITVVDTITPTITTPSSYSYEEFDIGKTISWMGGDNNPNNYTIFRDNLSIESGTWNNVDTIEISVDGLTLGDHNFTIVIYDISGNPTIHEVTITVIDSQSPIITGPDPIEYDEGDDDGRQIIWNFVEVHPAYYTITRNDVEIVSQTEWTTNDPIILPIEGLNQGDYIFFIELTDTSGNRGNNSVIIFVDNPFSVDTKRIDFEIEEFVYEGDVEALSIQGWQTTNDTEILGASLNAKLLAINVEGYNEGDIVTQLSLSSVNGLFPLILNYTSLQNGTYQWVFIFDKVAYDIQITPLRLYVVKILPHVLSIEIFVQSILIQGEEFSISARVSYNDPRNDSSSIGLNTLTPYGGGVPDVDVSFILTYLTTTGSEATLSETITTDTNGDAVWILTTEATDFIENILSISAAITDQVGLIGTSSEVTDFDLKVKEGNPFSGLLDDIADFIVAKIIIIGIILASMFVVIFYFMKSLRKRKHKFTEHVKESEDATDEIDGLRSMHGIIMTAGSTGIPFYEYTFTSARTSIDTALISGITTALSMFLNELNEEVLGFEHMERAGVSITSHKSDLSTMMVISDAPLPPIILSQLKNGHHAIESKFSKQLLIPDRMMNIEPINITNELISKSLKLNLKEGLIIRTNNLKKLQKRKSISRKIRNEMSELRKLNKLSDDTHELLNLEMILTFLKSKNIDHTTACRIIYLAYVNFIIVPI
ncbi:MAG: hypothetical protein HeimC2_07270 [Candidatus Heimdallarchaeota archaeon LC_2]|nr:MAG: hypothetical protein HeimC2_07270 [Candidatus Heimdallarchaeota archaeon LC_2]